jgi:enoyl-[acyl-carrier protein] reductase III
MQPHNSTYKSILITGGTRGIGRAIALKLAGQTQQIFLNYLHNEEEAFKTRELVEQEGAKCVLLKANMLYPDEIDEMFLKIREETDSLDSFIHCAALNAFKPTLAVKANQWDLTMNINTRALLLCAQHVAEMMQSGSIIALSSLGSFKMLPNYGALGPAKAAMESLVKYLAVELAPKNIRVNCVNAGPVDTDSLKKFPEHEEFLKTLEQQSPTGRIAQPEDIADIVEFLISEKSKWIIGQTIIADGGLSLR